MHPWVTKIYAIYIELTNRLSSTEDFLDSTGEFTGEGLVTHGTSDFDHIIQRDVTAVLDYKDIKISKDIYVHYHYDLPFFSFLRSRGGSFKALMTKEEAEGTTDT
jgi:hypothetical protein